LRRAEPGGRARPPAQPLGRVLMVEQNAAMALSIADRGYVLSTGEIVLEGPAAELLRSEDLKRAYLGR